MKLELPTPTSDEAVLSLSAAASGVAALQYGLAPRQAHHTFFFAPVGGCWLMRGWLSGGLLLLAALRQPRQRRRQLEPIPSSCDQRCS